MKYFKSNSNVKPNIMMILCAVILVTGFILNVFAQEEKLKDSDITSAIESELLIDEVVDMNTIDVKTQDGIVTFTGTVNNILARDRIIEIAERIKGVRAIVNRIVVEPSLIRTDEDIQNAVTNKLLNDPATDSYEVNVKVSDGTVTLTGTVQSWAEKELCSTVAKGVRGVREIKNDISINYETDRSDIEIKRDVEGRLANDVRVDDYLINVEVKDGKVLLSGTVGSLHEKNRAENDAWVIGVKSVDSDNLDIEWWARDRMHREEYYVSRSDEEIKKAVKDAFLYDPRVMSFNPDINVNLGTVTLTGIVDNLRAKKAAEQDARNTVGVWRVKNHLKVRPTEIPANEELEKWVENALLNDPYVERYDITIDASFGWIYLSGDVNTSFEKFQAEKVAESVQGVTHVVNNISFEYEWVWKPDWEIKEDIKDQLTWSIYVDENQVSVEVEDGVATLTGQVNNWSAYNTAEENAYEGGAKDVENNLTVKNRYYGPYYPYNHWRYPFYPYY